MATSTVSRPPRTSTAVLFRTKPRLLPLLWQLPASAIVAAVVSSAVQWCAGFLDVPPDSAVVSAWVFVTTVVIGFALVVPCMARRWPHWGSPAAWCGLSALATAPLALPLSGTPFYLFGLSGDQFFRTQYLTRLTDSLALLDGNYAGLPPFYPAGWFWLGGRFADLLGMPGWEAYKPWSIVTMAIAAALTHTLWSVVLRRPRALLMAAMTCVVGLRVAAYEPYSWVLIAVIVPVTVIVVRDLRNVALHRSLHWGPTVLAGVCLGLSGAVYTLLAGFFGLLLAGVGLHALAARWWANRGTAADGADTNADGADTTWRAGGRIFVRLVVAGLVAAPLVLLVWTPYFLGALRSASSPSSTATAFMPEISAFFPTSMFDPSVTGFLCLIGALWILWSWVRSDAARALGLVVAGCYLWYGASMCAVLVGTTLLPFRLEPLLVTCLFCGAGLALWQVVRWLRHLLPQHRPAVRQIAVVLGLVAFVQTTGTFRAALEEAVAGGLFSRAHATYDASGQRSSGPPDPADAGAWNDELIATIGDLSGKQTSELVLLTSAYHLLPLKPYFSFQTMQNPYANPLADYRSRRLLIESWARSRDAEGLIEALDRSPYRPPTVFVLARGDGELRMSVSKSTLAPLLDTEYYDVAFDESLFQHSEFVRRDVGPYAVIVRS